MKIHIIFNMLCVGLVLSIACVASADEWFEAEEASSYDYAAVAGIQIRPATTPANTNEALAAHTPRLEKAEIQALMIERETAGITNDIAITPVAIHMEPISPAHWFTYNNGCAGESSIWVPAGEPDPVITVVCICFAAKTPITTDKGIKPIADIKEGDMVLGKDGFRKVIKVTESSASPELSINGIETTPNHPFVMKNGELKRADELKIGDILFHSIKVETITKISRNEKTYNLCIEDDTYYVRDMLVHSGIPTKEFSTKTVEKVCGTKYVYTSPVTEKAFISSNMPHKE